MWKIFAGAGIGWRGPPLLGAAGAVPHDALTAASLVLEDMGAKWWLTYGALLGFVREGRFLPQDNDIDLAIIADVDPAKIAEALGIAGFVHDESWATAQGVVNQKFRYGGTFLDLFYVTRAGELYIDEYRLGGRWGGRSLARSSHPVMPTIPMDCGGLTVPVPADRERYLAHLYGPDWRVEVSYWNWRFSPPNAERHIYWLELPAMGFRWLKYRRELARATRRPVRKVSGVEKATA